VSSPAHLISLLLALAGLLVLVGNLVFLAVLAVRPSGFFAKTVT